MPPYAEQFAEKVAPQITEAAERFVNTEASGKRVINFNLKQLDPIEEFGKGLLGITANAPILFNNGVMFCSLLTAGRSGIQFFCTADPVAQGLYMIGFTCSSAAFTSSGISSWSRSCHLDYNALTGEVLGEGFLRLGNEAHHAALIRQGKFKEASKFRLRSSMFTKNSKLGFGSPYLGQKIPYRKLYKVSVVVLVVYGYVRYVLWIYRSSQKILHKFNKNKPGSPKQILKRIRRLEGFERIFKIIRVQRLANSSYAF